MMTPNQQSAQHNATIYAIKAHAHTHVLPSTLSTRSVMRNFKPSRPYGTTHTSGKRFPYAPSAIHWRSPIGDWRLASASPVSLPPWVASIPRIGYYFPRRNSFRSDPTWWRRAATARTASGDGGIGERSSRAFQRFQGRLLTPTR